MKAEAAFLIALCRSDIVRAREIARDELRGKVIVEFASRHQVDALAYWMWMERGADGPSFPLSDPESTATLKLAYLHHLMRNEWLQKNIVALEESLRARDVEGLYLKGPWLALRAYPDPGTRPVGDIDLCVREHDYEATLEVLRDLGYVASGPTPSAGKEALERVHYGRQLRFAARERRPLELHFRLVNIGPPSVDESWVWETSRELEVQSCPIRVPGPEAMLLQLFLHVNQHAFAVLRLHHDIRWALEQTADDVDWDLLRARIRELRVHVAVYHALSMARELAGARVPEPVLQSFKPSFPRRTYFSLAWRLKRARKLEARTRPVEVEAPLFYLLEMGRIRDKVRYVMAVVRQAGGWSKALGRLGGLLRKTRR